MVHWGWKGILFSDVSDLILPILGNLSDLGDVEESPVVLVSITKSTSLPTEFEFDDALPLSSIKLLGPGARVGE